MVIILEETHSFMAIYLKVLQNRKYKTISPAAWLIFNEQKSSALSRRFLGGWFRDTRKLFDGDGWQSKNVLYSMSLRMHAYVSQKVIYDVLRGSLPLAQFKKKWKTPLAECYFLKLSLLHGCFHVFYLYKWYQIAQNIKFVSEVFIDHFI